MRRYTSVAALGLRLTWKQVVALFAVVALAQWGRFSWNDSQNVAVEVLMDDSARLIGQLGFVGLLFVLSRAGGGKHGTSVETLRRLSLSEEALTICWGLVFAGYVLLYWGFQVGMCLAMYARYFRGEISLLRLGVASYRSHYFHHLLPLSEPWAMVRNVALILGYGFLSAQAGWAARRGRKLPMAMALWMAFDHWVLYPYDVGSQGADLALTAVAVLSVGIDWLWTKGAMRHEED